MGMVSGYSSTDLLIFSYDRPLQLYALLESIELNVSGLEELYVLYRASSIESERGYQELKKDFPSARFVPQSHTRARQDFKPLLLKYLFGSPAPYALFAVDDIVVTRPIDLGSAELQMERYGAFCFFFRLGLNIDTCYMTNQPSPVPPGNLVEPDLFLWRVGSGTWDWNYPHNVDLTLYRKREIFPFFYAATYSYPNDLEALWAHFARQDDLALCLAHSAMVNIPMNVVSSFNNRHMQSKTAAECLDLFLQGLKIDIAPLQGLENNSPHFEITPTFIPRHFPNEPVPEIPIGHRCLISRHS